MQVPHSEEIKRCIPVLKRIFEYSNIFEQGFRNEYSNTKIKIRVFEKMWSIRGLSFSQAFDRPAARARSTDQRTDHAMGPAGRRLRRAVDHRLAHAIKLQNACDVAILLRSSFEVQCAHADCGLLDALLVRDLSKLFHTLSQAHGQVRRILHHQFVSLNMRLGVTSLLVTFRDFWFDV